MATRIIEYGGRSSGDFPVVPADQFVVKQAAMTATGTSALSAAFKDATKLVRIQSDEQIYYEYDGTTAPTATTDSPRIAAGGDEWIKIRPGASLKIAIRT